MITCIIPPYKSYILCTTDVYTVIPFSQPATVAGLRDREWSSINGELASILAPLHMELANDIVSPCEAAVEFASLITAHLEHHGALRCCKPPSTNHQLHRTCAIVCLTKRLGNLKNNYRKQFPLDRTQFLNAVCAHNKALRAARQQQQQRLGRKQ